MSFSSPDSCVSRSFYEVCVLPVARLHEPLSHEGSRTDKHCASTRCIWSSGVAAARRLAQTESHVQAAKVVGSRPPALGASGRSALIAAPSAFLLLVGGGVAARSVMEIAWICR